MIVTPDVEMLLAQRMRDALSGSWPGLYVSRAKPSTERPYEVVVQYAGGVPKQLVLDQVRVQVNIWVNADEASPEQVANDLSQQVRSKIEALRFQSPFKEVTASVPVAVNEKGEPPQRFFYAEMMVRRTTT